MEGPLAVLGQLIDCDDGKFRRLEFRWVVQITQSQDAAAIVVVEMEGETVGLGVAHTPEPGGKLEFDLADLPILERRVRFAEQADVDSNEPARAELDEPMWFLQPPEDVRSSSFLELVATEFAVQGLELDWVGLCWDADFRG